MVFISAKTDTRTGFNIPLNEVYANSIVNVLISPWKQQKYIFLGHNGEKTYSTCQCISLEKCRFDEIRGCCCLFKFQMRQTFLMAFDVQNWPGELITLILFNRSAKLTWRVDIIILLNRIFGHISSWRWNCIYVTSTHESKMYAFSVDTVLSQSECLSCTSFHRSCSASNAN